MLYNLLDHTITRKISSCNFNQHINSIHPDRIMDEHDLIYIKEGNWNICQDGIFYDLNPGDIILLQSNHHHYGVTACTSLVKTCFVHFNSSVNDAIGNPDEGDANFFKFPIALNCKNNPLVEHYFNKMIYAYWSDDAYAKQKAAAYLNLCLCELSSRNEAQNRNSPLIEDIKRQIKLTPYRFISIGEFADKYSCSVRTISSKFKENTGYSLHAWQMKLKCEMADELMHYDPALTLKEVASIYGFYDEYHFSKCYKKHFGCTPIRKLK